MDEIELIYILESRIAETGKHIDSFAGERGSMITRAYSAGERDAYVDILNIIIKEKTL